MPQLPPLRLAWMISSIVLLVAAITMAVLTHPESAPQENASSRSAEPTPEKALALNAAAARSAPDQIPDPGPLPRSLAGARPDIQLQTDANGNLVVNQDVRVLFDFFLAGIADEPMETVLARIQHSLAEQLDGKGLEQARDLLRRYVDYRIALDDLEAETPRAMADGSLSVTALRERLRGLRNLRASHFNREETRAFFGLDQVQDDYMVRRLAITQDDSLSESQRRHALDELEQQLPRAVREVRERVTRHGEIYAKTESLRSSGASDDEIYRVRARAFGPEAAENLARLDDKRADWERRLNEYARQRDAIRRSGLSPEDRKAALEQLIESRFDKREQMRVRALNDHL